MAMDSKGMTDLFQQWQKSATDTAQMWANLYSKRPEADPLEGYRQMSEVWLKAFSGAFKQQVAPTDPESLRKFMDESLEMWTKTFADMMGGQDYSTAMGQLLAQNLAAQGSLRKAIEPQMEETLRTLNIPSRKQVLAVAEQLKAIEQRLEDMEERLEDVQATLARSSASAAETAAATTAPASKRPRKAA
ncbi:MAG: hypothetical protein EXR47_05290 [Dehalococcoidia bacterium]|nr:hypothetical protein [Dehalococcoidia bacterium]